MHCVTVITHFGLLIYWGAYTTVQLVADRNYRLGKRQSNKVGDAIRSNKSYFSSSS